VFEMTSLKLLVPVFLILLLMSVPVYAGDLQDGLNAYGRGEYRTAFEKFNLLAEQGDGQAQWYLSGLYARGMGVNQDFVQALKWSAIAGANGVEIANYGRNLLQKNMTSAQINRAYRLGQEWMSEYNLKWKTPQ
jgi:TPR repeat protein